MVQMMCLVLFFNLPMPYSLVFLLLFSALIEEVAKGVGIYTIYARDPLFLTWKNLLIACAAIAIGFLVGEKLLLFATLAQNLRLDLRQYSLLIIRISLAAVAPSFRLCAYRCLLPQILGQKRFFSRNRDRDGRALPV